LIIAAVLLLCTTGFGEYNSHSVLFLTVPNGARQTAMGETGVSCVGGGSSAWWNPAFIAAGESEIEFNVFRWIADFRGSFGAARFKTGWGGLAVYYFNQGAGDFEARDRPGPSQETFSVHQTMFAGGTGFNLGKGIKTGLVYKTAVENIYGYRQDDYHALDLGVGWRADAWSAGAALANVELISNAGEPFPTTIRAGLSHFRRFSQFALVASGEGSTVLDGDTYLHFGVEVGWNELLFLRGGYMTGHDSRGLSFGTGVELRRYRVDVSIVPFENELGTVWRIGLGIVI